MKMFKDMFRESRTNKNLQQKDVAAALEVVPAYISRLEKGFSLPSNELILKICRVLDLDVEEVYLQVTLEKTENENIRHLVEGLLQAAKGSTLSSEDRAMAEKFSKLSEPQKKVVSNLMESFSGME